MTCTNQIKVKIIFTRNRAGKAKICKNKNAEILRK